jgi:ATP-dependent DNA helicase RecG
MIEQLGKILALESDQGYRDRAVIGGLSCLAERWEREMAHLPGMEEVASLLRAYKTLDGQAARQVHVERLRAALSQYASTPPPSTGTVASPSKPKKSRPAGARVRPTPSPKPGNAEHLGLDAPVTALSGVNKGYAARLARLGVTTIRDLLQLFPRRYDDFRRLKLINQLELGEEVTIIATVWEASVRHTRSGMQLVQAVLSDDTGMIQCTWFNRAYLVDKLVRGKQIVLSGQVEHYQGHLTFQNPEWEMLDRELLHTARLVPVYPLTEGISNRWLRRLMKRSLDYWGPRLADHLPEHLIKATKLVGLNAAIEQIHFPDNWSNLERARQRLAFDELFLIQLGVLMQRRAWRAEPGRALEFEPAAVERFVAELPYPLTGAQQRALADILADLRQAAPMNRLLQGDVGSGKTVVAAAAAWATLNAGAQVALMAPTEILAEQHANTLKTILEGKDASICLLTGSTPEADKQRIYASLASGEIQIAIGTHALIQPELHFRDLALVVIDEQHRFGVRQRAALRQKGYTPHMLVMTATPIPRTLALTLYGDLDPSIIDELPPGRQKIETHWLLPTERERAYQFIHSQVDKGHQAFIICPLVEESEKLKVRDQEVKAAVEEHERLKTHIFPHLRLGLLHGRMKSEEKESTMGKFVRGELDILVSTSVVEVGIDVPNATVMLIEGANRFGLSQLHQFRGRVGRGTAPSYCLLLADSSSVVSDERLQAIENIDDGFQLAEKDLELRGPGEFFGTRQSGLPDMRLAKLSDLALLDLARKQAEGLIEADPELSAPEHRPLAEKVTRFWSGEGDVS